MRPDCSSSINNTEQNPITYAVWAGLGIVLVAVIGAILYRQIPDITAVIGMALIVAGVVIINILLKTIRH